MKVKDMMHKGAQCVTPDTDITTVARHMKTLDIGAIPVVQDNALLGMVTDRDIAVRGLADGRSAAGLTARDVMTTGVVSCRDNAKVKDALARMEREQVRRLPVVDKDGNVVGMVSFGDIAHALSRKRAGEMTRALSAHHA